MHMVCVTLGGVQSIEETQKGGVKEDCSVVMLGKIGLRKLTLLKKVEIMDGVHLKAINVLIEISAMVICIHSSLNIVYRV